MTGDRSAASAGCDEYAIKPIDRRKLVAVCARLMASGDAIRAPFPSPRSTRDVEARTPDE
jgi:hypothetical protein